MPHTDPGLDFFLFWLQNSTIPLQKLVPGTPLFVITNGPIPGKAQVWARQKNESADMMFWGYVKADLLQDSPAKKSSTEPSPDKPAPTAFDVDYGLYEGDGTNFERTSGNYYLSPRDRTLLVRRRGLDYFKISGSLELITPPEVRRAAGGRGVLISFGLGDLMSAASGGFKHSSPSISPNANSR